MFCEFSGTIGWMTQFNEPGKWCVFDGNRFLDDCMQYNDPIGTEDYHIDQRWQYMPAPTNINTVY
jgi:hypothetical protein